ncbi:MAG TPA: thioredoxin family protein [Terriglobales bacterium]|nr:thioredoxin family protein [Terriglobales bacterium]
MDRVLALTAVAALVAVFVVWGRLLAARRLRRLRAVPVTELWAALDGEPDGRPTVVAFSTPSCIACRSAQRPALVALEELAGGQVRVLHVDAAARPDVARAFGVLTVPATTVLDERGAVLAANQGFATAETLAGQLGLRLAPRPA